LKLTLKLKVRERERERDLVERGSGGRRRFAGRMNRHAILFLFFGFHSFFATALTHHELYCKMGENRDVF